MVRDDIRQWCAKCREHTLSSVTRPRVHHGPHFLTEWRTDQCIQPMTWPCRPAAACFLPLASAAPPRQSAEWLRNAPCVLAEGPYQHGGVCSNKTYGRLETQNELLGPHLLH